MYYNKYISLYECMCECVHVRCVGFQESAVSFLEQFLEIQHQRQRFENDVGISWRYNTIGLMCPTFRLRKRVESADAFHIFNITEIKIQSSRFDISSLLSSRNPLGDYWILLFINPLAVILLKKWLNLDIILNISCLWMLVIWDYLPEIPSFVEFWILET